MRAAEVEIPRLHLDRHWNLLDWQEGMVTFSILNFQWSTEKLNTYNDDSYYEVHEFNMMISCKKDFMHKWNLTHRHLPTVVKDLHIFNLQLQAICISSNMFQGIGQLMKLIIVLQIQGAPILVPSCPWKSRLPHFKHIQTCMQTTCHVAVGITVALLVCFFLERFNKNWGSKSKKIRNWNQKPRSENLVPAHW